MTDQPMPAIPAFLNRSNSQEKEAQTMTDKTTAHTIDTDGNPIDQKVAPTRKPRAKKKPAAATKAAAKKTAATTGELVAIAKTDTPEPRMIDPRKIDRPAFNPRQTFDPVTIAELAESIAANGLAQAVTVRPGSKAGRYELVAGERRHRAILSLYGMKDPRAPAEIPAIVRTLTDRQAVEIATVENADREDVAPLDEARAYAKMIELARAEGAKDYGTAEIAAAIGKTRRHVQLRLALVNKLTPATQKALETGKLSLAKARAMTAAPADLQSEILEDVIKASYWSAERVADEIRHALPVLGAEIFDRSKYTGETGEPGTDSHGNQQPATYQDRKQFWDLQNGAIAEKAKELRGKWKACKVFGPREHFMSWQYNKTKDTTQGIAVIEVDRDGTVTIREGLVLNPAYGTPAERDQASKDKAAAKRASTPWTLDHLRRARAARTNALQQAVADNAPAAMRIVAFQLLVSGNSALSAIATPHRHADTGWLANAAATGKIAAAFEVFTKATGIELDRYGVIRGKGSDAEAAATLWKGIGELTKQQAEQLFAAAVARTVAAFAPLNPYGYTVNGPEAYDDAVTIALAEDLDIAGNEARHGLGAGATIRSSEDLKGLKGAALATIADGLGCSPSGKEPAKKLREFILAKLRTEIEPAPKGSSLNPGHRIPADCPTVIPGFAFMDRQTAEEEGKRLMAPLPGTEADQPQAVTAGDKAGKKTPTKAKSRAGRKTR